MAAYCREVEGRPNKSWIQCALFDKGSVNSEGIVTPKIKEAIKGDYKRAMAQAVY